MDMKEFDTRGWTGLMELAAPDRRKAILGRRKHYVATLRQRVAYAVVAEACYQPPPEKVRFVKEAFELAAKRQETGCVIQVLHDSFSHPMLAGMRSAPRTVRQLLYRAEPYQIDLQIELHPEENRLVVTGQLLDVSRPEMVGQDVQVMLSDGLEHIVHTATNQFGEFRAEVENSGDLELSFLSPGKKPIVVLLRGALDQLSKAKE